MFPIIGPIVAALGSALGIGAAGGAATGIGALFSNAWLPALGTGIGTLLTGGSGKDALRNAAIAGGGSMLFPGVGKGVSGGIAQLMGIGGQQVSGPRDMGMAARFAPPERPAGLAENLAATQAAQAPAAPIPPIGGDIQERRRTTLPGISTMIPLDPRLEGLPEIPEIPYKSLYSPEFEAGNRGLDILYQGYNEDPTIMSGDVDPSIAKNLPFVDPYTMKRYASQEERDAAIDISREFLSTAGVPLKSYGARKYATGGEIQGPGTGTSDSVPATIYQGGKPVKDAALSDGEFVMTAKAVRGMGNGSRERGVTRMYELMRRFENGEMA
jgi:hypothetical protein